MLSHTLVALALSAISPVLSTSLTSAPSTLTRSCGTSISGEAIVAAERHFSANKVARKTAAEDRTIDVWFHVISESEELAGGNIPDEQVTDQINYLNSAFNSTGLSFALQNITRTVNEDWFNNARPNSTQQTDMKEALRFGLVDTLNVYSVNLTETGILGYATFPISYNDAPENDGVVLRFSTLPGGALAPFNLGGTLVHEVGHWVGLYHTFEGGCPIEGDAPDDSQGDYVDDTPSEQSPASGCPEGRDTCSAEGVDPIHNYMDYTDDACYEEFTPGQIARLTEQMDTYRRA